MGTRLGLGRWDALEMAVVTATHSVNVLTAPERYS